MSDSFDKTTGAVPGAGSMDTAQRRKALEQELAPKMEGETRDRGEAAMSRRLRRMENSIDMC